MKNNNTWLLVLPVKDAHVQHIDANGAFIWGTNQIRRNVGKTYNSENNTWELSKEPVAVPYHPEYIRALKEKSLLPADQATATLAGLSFQKENK